jgi:hypothetical protein
MDLAGSEFIRKVFIKERGKVGFQKNPPVPHLVRAL